MSMRPHILFLAHRIPFPPDKGDKIRSFRILAHLAERFSVHLGCFVDDPEDLRHEAALRQYTESQVLVPLSPLNARLRSMISLGKGEPLSLGYYDDPRMRAFVSDKRRLPLAAEVAFSSQMAQYLLEGGEAPCVIDICDADSEKWRQYAERASGPQKWLYSREAARLSEYEAKIVNGADATLIISAAEASILESRCSFEKPLHVFGNGVDTGFFNPAAQYSGEDSPEVVFVGAMDYRANVEAVHWFVSSVWPLVRASKPSAGFGVVGSRPAASVRALDGRNGVTVTGRVPDVRPFLARAKAVVAPLRVARGVQNKVLEAMAMARPVVATPAANTGIDAAAGSEILIQETPEAFAASVCQLIGDPGFGDSIGRAARLRIEAEFGWANRLKDLDAALLHAGVLAGTARRTAARTG